MDKKVEADYAEMITPESNFHVVLYQPEIPSNTGNIGRICVGTNSTLHIIKPMRFLLTDKLVKRAGLDYWNKLSLKIHDSFDSFLADFPNSNIYYCTTKTNRKFTELKYKKGDVFMFGPESRGIPEEILNKYYNQNITIPMNDQIRSINLSNSVAIVIYEAWRQIGY
ncbi:MAG: tRNA (cytidine(34)-2'-O)-methyltransferase [Candidatus Tenebribacter davisii]|jgi:tRNA (cytidine/uridine-2'-O-)-methyltransferase|nr:tRNA (cytidine(34)-2'-O)-methyltransferase [Candidatus Tenebribacter davisii]